MVICISFATWVSVCLFRVWSLPKHLRRKNGMLPFISFYFNSFHFVLFSFILSYSMLHAFYFMLFSSDFAIWHMYHGFTSQYTVTIMLKSLKHLTKTVSTRTQMTFKF